MVSPALCSRPRAGDGLRKPQPHLSARRIISAHIFGHGKFAVSIANAWVIYFCSGLKTLRGRLIEPGAFHPMAPPIAAKILSFTYEPPTQRYLIVPKWTRRGA